MTKRKGVSEAYLDSIFSKYIRLKYADEGGYVTCCYCGGRLHWTEAQNCHYVGRRHRTLRWNELNTHPGHGTCNGADIILGYTEYMVARYGAEVFRLLTAAKNNRQKITPFERKIMADNYNQKIKQLRKEKGL